MGLSAFYGAPPPDEDRFKVLDRAYELGQTFWDSSDIYGDSEELVGAWFKRTDLRSKIFLATKFGIKSNPNGSISTNNSPEYVKEACAKSLSRLGTDYIDLYYCHRLDLKTPIEKTVQAMAELKAEGKIKYLGLSEVSSETLRRACKVHHISAVQVEYSPFAMDIESPQIDLLRTARELGVAIVAYSPLGRGFLTGKYKSRDQFEEGDFRKVLPRFNEENFPKNLELVESLSRIATSKGCTIGQLTLAWLMAQGDDIIPIPGTTKIKYLEENWGALQVSLSDDEERTIRAEIQKAEVAGARYPQSMLRDLYADSPALD
jgi:hypothetical protein